MKITTILPVSRLKYLDRVIESLLNQTRKPNNLLVVYDGIESQFLEARNKIVGLDFDSVLFVHSTNLAPAHSIPDRRRHIVNIHNQMRELIDGVDWVFSIEDDGILPPDALEKLLTIVENSDNAGMVTGVELGRWGKPYVGAWIVDNVHEPKQISSIENKTSSPSIDEIDGCGLYCALIRADYYRQHQFFTSNGLGPDVNLGLFLRQQGFKNYIDWSVQITHLTSFSGLEVEIPATDNSIIVNLRHISGSTWQVYR